MELTYNGSQVLIALGLISLCLVLGIYITRRLLHRGKDLQDDSLVSKKYPYLDVLRYRIRPVGLGGVLSLAAVVILMSWTSYEPVEEYIIDDWANDEMEEIPPIIPIKAKPLPVLPPPVVEIEVTDEIILEEPDFTPLEWDDEIPYEPAPFVPSAASVPAAPLPPLPKVKDDIEEIMDISEHMPLFGGCEDRDCSDKKLFRYLSKQVKYPTIAKENGVTGKVYVQFVVEKDGKIGNINVVRGIGAGCDEEVLRVINKMNTLNQSWTPGRHHGHKVRVKYTLPINFQLN